MSSALSRPNLGDFKSFVSFLLQESMQPHSFLQVYPHSHFIPRTHFFSLGHLVLAGTEISGTLPTELGLCTSLGTLLWSVGSTPIHSVKLTLPPLSAQSDWTCTPRFCQGKYRMNWAIYQDLVSGWLLVVTRKHLQTVSHCSSSFSLEFLDAADCDFSGTIPDSIFSIASLCKSLILPVRKMCTYFFRPLLPFYFPSLHRFAEFGQK
jgi:hypothetical protein